MGAGVALSAGGTVLLPNKAPSGPSPRFWISLTTKLGATIVPSTPSSRSSMPSDQSTVHGCAGATADGRIRPIAAGRLSARAAF